VVAGVQPAADGVWLPLCCVWYLIYLFSHFATGALAALDLITSPHVHYRCAFAALAAERFIMRVCGRFRSGDGRRADPDFPFTR